MRTLKLRLALLAVALLFGISTDAQTPSVFPVTISVRDMSGAQVLGAAVHIIPETPSPPAKMETDQTGELHLLLPPRAYEISVTAQGFKIAKQQIHVTERQDA